MGDNLSAECFFEAICACVHTSLFDGSWLPDSIKRERRVGGALSPAGDPIRRVQGSFENLT